MTTQNIQTAQTAQTPVQGQTVQTAPQSIHAKLMHVRNTIKSGKEAYNSFGKYSYRNAEQMLAGINPILQKYGLTLDFSDEILFVPPSRYYIKTTCTVHDTVSGESYSVTALAREQEQKKGMDEAQVTGSTMTYCHKYALMGMFAISDPKMDPDSMDNTQAQTQFQPAQNAPQQIRTATPAPAPQGYNNGGYGTYYGNNRAYRQA